MSEIDLFGNPVEPKTPRARTQNQLSTPVRVLKAKRSQGEWREHFLDDLIPSDHRARCIWTLIGALDLAPLYAEVRAREAYAGRPAIDPKILLALWTYATTEGISSARELDRLCTAHDAYRWICGGVPVNYHTLSDFRSLRFDQISQVMTDLLSVLDASGFIRIDQVAIDGTRVRASAGAASFHRKRSIAEAKVAAKKLIADLAAQGEAESAQVTARQRAARERAARELEERLEAASKQLEALSETATSKEKDVEKLRVSTTDAEAKVMKMPDGGFRPAYNVQIAADVDSRIIVGVDVVATGSDRLQLMSMLNKVHEMNGHYPNTVLADGGYAWAKDIDRAESAGITVIAPTRKPGKGRSEGERIRYDTDNVARWRARMAEEKTKRAYRARAATVETINGDLKTYRGLGFFRVRGLRKVNSVAILIAFAYNLMTWSALIAAQSAQGT